MKNENTISIGDRVRIISTGQEVTVDQVSAYGFSVIKFNSGGTYRFLNHKLEKPAETHTAYNAQAGLTPLIKAPGMGRAQERSHYVDK